MASCVTYWTLRKKKRTCTDYSDEKKMDDVGIVNQEVRWISKGVMTAAMRRIKSGKAG